MTGAASTMDGILNIDKPRGMTSFAVVAAVRRLSSERRVGHSGTLDPEATGVLPVFCGRATRVIEFLADTTKTYRAGIELGVATDSYDAAGRVVARGDASRVRREDLAAALEPFRGLIEQTPPMYSAVKHQGQPLYRLARAGITVERRRRKVEVSRLELIDWRPPLVTLEIDCSKGTYIRALANDLGEALGCGAMLSSLVRLRCGPFALEDAAPFDGLALAFEEDRWQALLRSADSVLGHWPAVQIGEELAAAVRNGQLVDIGEPAGEATGGYRRAYAADGSLLAVLRFEPEVGLWHPDKVFR
ncbi:MAG: tRNA pseudouridine(55) synthase TruB [Dehalococcoidales bacterium]